MENSQKSISNVPMILGIIGGVVGLPAAMCSGFCAAGISALATDGTNTAAAGNTGMVFLCLGIIAALVGFVSSFLYKKNPLLWGIIMISAGILSGITLITFNILSLIVTILFLIGGIISLTQKKSTIE
jgi:hypothetical protein